MAKTPLGNFEYLVLHVVRSMNEQREPAYGIGIANKLLSLNVNPCAQAQVYSRIYLLKNKGYLVSYVEDAPRSLRGGKRRTLYAITEAGVAAEKEGTLARKGIFAVTRKLANRQSFGAQATFVPMANDGRD